MRFWKRRGGLLAAAELRANNRPPGYGLARWRLPRVTPDTPLTRVLTPDVFAAIGRGLTLRGQVLYEIRVDDAGGISLVESCGWEVRSRSDGSLVYLAEFAAPDRTITRRIPEAAALLFVWARDPAAPWAGIGPLHGANLTRALARYLERSWGYEAGGAVGSILPIPDGVTSEQAGKLRDGLSGLNGGTIVLETTSQGWGQGAQAAPRGDFEQKRLGMEIENAAPTLRGQVASDILGACGVPAVLTSGTSSAAAREAWRGFLFGSVAPMARLLEVVMADGLATPGLRLDFAELQASDLMGRSRAFKSLRDGGLSTHTH